MITTRAPSPPTPDLATIIRAYYDVTERLKQSHDMLGREIYRLREELAAKNRELQRRERLAALGEMAAGVAHEIRNPLGGIGLYVSLLARELADRPDQLDLVRRMAVGVRSLESVVGDILMFAGEGKPDCREVSLGVILDSVLTHTAGRTEAQGATIDVQPDLEGVTLCCDAGQVERALLNLILNALDAAGDRGHVWVRGGDGRDGMFSLVVEDDGPGIDPAFVDRIFHPFFTTKAGGTGLGLAIVHRIAEAHGGNVVAGQRDDGDGAAMVLSLPLAKAPRVLRQWEDVHPWLMSAS